MTSALNGVEKARDLGWAAVLETLMGVSGCLSIPITEGLLRERSALCGLGGDLSSQGNLWLRISLEGGLGVCSWAERHSGVCRCRPKASP